MPNEELKHKTVKGLFWNFIDNFAKLGIGFIIGIILARLLTPKEFGLIGMTTIFIAVSNSFIDSGFSQALIRKKECSQADYSTVFLFNLAIGIFFYLILFFTAGLISEFFEEPQLKNIIRVIGISLIISSFSLIQGVRLTKSLNFKLQARITIITIIISGIIAIIMAYEGYGVWSLVSRTIITALTGTLLLWLWNNWKPSLKFSKKAFREMFSFGSKLLVSGLLHTTFTNIYYLIIGKYFSASDLGYYTRAEMFQKLPSENISRVVQRVSFPVLSSIQDEESELRSAYQRLIKSTMLITFVLMFGMAAAAKPMVLTLIGEKWLPSVVYLQLLCFVGIFYPLHSINLNILIVKGRSDLFLKLEIIKKILIIPVIVFGILFGIKILIIGMIIHAIIEYFLNSYWSGKFINYSIIMQLHDIAPSFILGAINGLCLYLLANLINASPLATLLLQIGTGTIITILSAELLRMKSYLYIKEIIKEKLIKRH